MLSSPQRFANFRKTAMLCIALISEPIPPNLRIYCDAMYRSHLRNVSQTSAKLRCYVSLSSPNQFHPICASIAMLCIALISATFRKLPQNCDASTLSIFDPLSSNFRLSSNVHSRFKLIYRSELYIRLNSQVRLTSLRSELFVRFKLTNSFNSLTFV